VVWRLGVAFGVGFATLLAFASPAVADPGNGNAYGNDNGAEQSATHSNSSNHATDGTAGTSGDPTLPQPPSTADDNGTGANVNGPYDSTRDGSASENGNDGGNATGKPCAGCVGKADNKNPPGQQPGPEDHNNGYECDGNNGIAKTNPAHTGCVDPGNPPPDCDAAVEDCTPGCDAAVEDCTPDCDAAVEDCTPGCDAAVQDCSPACNASVQSCSEVLGEVITRDPVVSGAALARTGIDVLDPVAFSALMLAAGGLLVAGSRRLQRSRS
jgi:hypothetical protein